MSLIEIAKFPVELLGPINPVTIDLHGSVIAVGFGDNNWPPGYGVVWFDLSTPQDVSTLMLRPGNVMQNIDGYVYLLGLRPESIALIEEEHNRLALCLFDRRRTVWRRIDGSPIVGCTAGASHLVHMKADGSELEVVSLGAGLPGQTHAHAPVVNASSIAVNEALSHVVVAHEGGLTCSRLGGAQECSWPSNDGINRLWFAEDDLAVFGASRNELVLYQWGGDVQRFAVPGLRPFAGMAPRTRSAFFRGRDEYVELDLSNGRPRSSGKTPEGLLGVDIEGRRLVTLHQPFRTQEEKLAGGEGARNWIRVFQMT